ncbi:uncharacterized protein MONOS_1756 [Monocercomonoides exilis]|uniref:uncharacterized protein n=1 Tax=Monocercomonoides exilis TaxID=2049356 RepID=UPI0035599EF9|nr:hypothetical protein MONOS_1756 [Monocercomonoides exilis]|eukprot:MONOS_1756.1-p1 / transcript=MONOS_1756.1 / gene=MONOS_1756 / organism=Monocercomonoides_exilis_PA203 / gene_product=unspecified product / transcript_product=unspecified product / location=Mono_scaffold00032:163503-166613(-) / protein_length=1037 / sequence_SO=supercontig / SO=protein_coding / is_pseudo=false
MGFIGCTQRYTRRNQTNLEGEVCKRSLEEGGGCWERLPWHQAGGRRMRKVGSGRPSDEDPGSASSRFSKMSQHAVFRQEEERQIQADIGLQTSQQRSERNTLQDGRSQDSGEVTSKRGLRYNNRFVTGVLSNSCSPFFHSLSCIHSQRQNIRLQRDALRLQGRATHFHTFDEEGRTRNTTQMGAALPSLFGRHRTAASRPEQASESNEGDNRMAWKAWTVGQLRQEQAAAETDIRLSRMDMEDEERYSQLGAGEMQVLEEGVQTVDETCKEKLRGQDQELCIVCRSHQRHTVRHQRRFASNEQIIQGSQQSSEEGRMEYDDESQPLDHQADSWMEDETEREGGKTLDIVCNSRRDVDNRCFTSGLWCNPPNRQLSVPLSPTFQQGFYQPILQLQGDVGCLNGPQALPSPYPGAPHTHNPAKIRQHDGGLRHQSLGSGSESSLSSEENPKDDNRMEHSDEGCSPTGNKEHDSRRTLKATARWRLRNHKRSIKRAGTSVGSYSRTGRLCKRHKQESNDLVWTRKSRAGGRTSSRLERSGDASSSTSPSDSSLPQEDTGRTRESSDSSSSLEVPGLDTSSERDDDILLEMERFEENTEGRPRNEEVGSITPTGTLLSSKTQLVAQRGEQWWISSLQKCGVPQSLIAETKNSVSPSTWTADTFGFAHFGQIWTEENCGEFPSDFGEWCRRCAMLFVKLKEKKFPYTCLCATRSAVSLFSRQSYGEDIGQIPIIKTIFRSFHRSHVPRRPFTYMWSPSLVFDYYNSRPCNTDLSFFELSVKCILLCVLFTACRFHELELLFMSKSIFNNDAIHIYTHLKTSIPPSYLTIPFLSETDERICPARAVDCLWERVRRTYESRDTFLLNTNHHTPLKTSGIRRQARLGMTQVGIPQEFRPYTIKHAAISALTLKGIPEVLIARHARLSPTAHTPTRSYFRTNLASSMAHALIAPQQENQTSLTRFSPSSAPQLAPPPTASPPGLTTCLPTNITFQQQPPPELTKDLNTRDPNPQTEEMTKDCSRFELTTIRTIQTSEIRHIQADR